MAAAARIIVLILLAVCIARPGLAPAATAADPAPVLDTAAAQKLAAGLRKKFTPKHPETVLEGGALQFHGWQAFYSFIATLHDIELSTENLLKLSSWSTLDWQRNELLGWWYAVMRVDFDNDSSAVGTIRGPRQEGSFFVVMVKQEGLVLIGAFGGNYYDFTKMKEGMHGLKPFWPSPKNKDCCFTSTLEWDSTMYKPAPSPKQ